MFFFCNFCKFNVFIKRWQMCNETWGEAQDEKFLAKEEKSGQVTQCEVYDVAKLNMTSQQEQCRYVTG